MATLHPSRLHFSAQSHSAAQVWKCKLCVVMKRGMSTGYSGVDNPLFYKKNARLFFGDAKKSVDLLVTETEKVPPPPQRFFFVTKPSPLGFRP